MIYLDKQYVKYVDIHFYFVLIICVLILIMINVYVMLPLVFSVSLVWGPWYQFKDFFTETIKCYFHYYNQIVIIYQKSFNKIYINNHLTIFFGIKSIFKTSNISCSFPLLHLVKSSNIYIQNYIRILKKITIYVLILAIIIVYVCSKLESFQPATGSCKRLSSRKR